MEEESLDLIEGRKQPPTRAGLPSSRAGTGKNLAKPGYRVNIRPMTGPSFGGGAMGALMSAPVLNASIGDMNAQAYENVDSRFISDEDRERFTRQPGVGKSAESVLGASGLGVGGGLSSVIEERMAQRDRMQPYTDEQEMADMTSLRSNQSEFEEQPIDPTIKSEIETMAQNRNSMDFSEDDILRLAASGSIGSAIAERIASGEPVDEFERAVAQEAIIRSKVGDEGRAKIREMWERNQPKTSYMLEREAALDLAQQEIEAQKQQIKNEAKNREAEIASQQLRSEAEMEKAKAAQTRAEAQADAIRKSPQEDEESIIPKSTDISNDQLQLLLDQYDAQLEASMQNPANKGFTKEEILRAAIASGAISI